MLSTSMVFRKYYSLLLLIFIFSCKPNKKIEVQQLNGYALGTSYSITFTSAKLKKEILALQIDSIIGIINASMSTYLDNSDISKINKGDSLLQVDLHFQNVYHTASKVWKKTSGYFDPTVGALVNAYGFGPHSNLTKISEVDKDKILLYTGWDKTILTSKNTIQKKHPKVYFDFNALAKGYTVDLIAEHLRENQILSFLVEIGGEIVAQGVSPKSNEPWKVAIDDPNQLGVRKYIQVINLKDQALATSGNYRKFKVDEVTGKRLVHSINPKTGNPFPTKVISASVIAPNCMIADAYATDLMVMPFEQSKALIEREKELEAFWIIESETGLEEKYFSPGFPKNHE